MKHSEFQRKIWNYYRAYGRDLPWRRTRDPYKILVSEMMLQQTQVSRVVDKYKQFIKQFPDFKALAQSALSDVLIAWQGLGYNRRAKYLDQTAQKITKDYNGKLPVDAVLLQELPGIGKGTVGALLAFAFNIPSVFIETNIRSAYIYHFFKKKKNVSDTGLMELIEKTVDRKNPREWYYALMDHGSMLKATIPNPSRRSAHHAKQSKFEGSNRQVRGAIIRVLAQNPDVDAAQLAKLIDFSLQCTKISLIQLTKEGLIVSVSGRYRLA